MKQLYLIRHGETEWARTGKHTGLTDIPLNEQGKQHALLLGKRLQYLSFDHVFSSPLIRAFETCTLCGLEPELNPDLLEWNYGDYEGLTSSEIHKTDPHWNIFTHGAPNGESIENVKNRIDHLLKKLKPLKGKIALFSSGHFSRAFASQWLDLPIAKGKNFSLSTASFSILGYENQNQVLKLWNDTSHYGNDDLNFPFTV